MALIKHEETFTVAADPATIRDRVLAWFGPVGAKVVTDAPDRLEVKSGSQTRVRLLGGAFIRPSAMPTRTVVTMQRDGDATRVTVTAADAFGFGAKTGIKQKYTARVQEIVAGLHETLTTG
jgi:hypothetical protein